MSDAQKVDRRFRTGQLARLFQVDPSTILRWTERGLPYEWDPSGQRRYRESAVRAWYQARVAEHER